MRRFTRSVVLVLASAIVAVPAAIRAEEAAPTPTPIPPLIERVGLPLPEERALQQITFRPFLPAHPIETAVLAPFHTTGFSDKPENYGIAFAYVQKGHTFVLRQWPRARGSLGTFAPLPGEPLCKESFLTLGAVRDVQGVGWQTGQRVFVLQADDEKLHDKGRALKAEWHRLALRGACR
jgi:hypothetical protein